MLKKIKNAFESLSLSEKFFLFLSAIVLIGLGIFTFTESNLHFNSDTATANLLAEEMVRSKSFFPPDWYYAQDVWVIFLHLPIAFMTLFSDNYLGMHSVSAIIFIALAVASCIYLSRKVFKNNAWLVALPLLFCGLSLQYSVVVFGQCAYIVTLIYCFFAPALFCDSVDEEFRIKSYPKFIFLLLFVVLMGLTGTRFIQAVSIPLIGATFLLYLINNHDKEVKTIKKPLISVIGKLMLLIVAVGLGLLLFFVIQSSVNFIQGDTVIFFLAPDQLIDQIYHILMSLATLIDIVLGVPLFSVTGIMNILRLFTAILFLIVFPILQIRKFKEENHATKFFILFVAVHTAEIVILALFTEIITDATARYWLPVEIMLLFLSAHYIYKYVLSKRGTLISLVVSCIVVVCVAPATVDKLTSFIGYKDQMNEKTAIIDFLKENDLDRGYATYWNAGVYTVLSNGEIEINSVINGQLKPYYWLNSSARYSDEVNPGKTFLMLTESENAEFPVDSLKLLGKPEKVLNAYGYVVYVYNYNIARNNFAGFDVLGESPELTESLQNILSPLTDEYKTDKFFIFDVSKNGVYTSGLPDFDGNVSEYSLKNILLIPSESEEYFPKKYLSAYSYLKTENGYNIYIGELAAIDTVTGLPDEGVSIDLPFSNDVHTVNGELSEGTFITDGTDGIKLYGPYADTRPGTYEFTLHYEVISSNNEDVGWFDVATSSGSVVRANAALDKNADTVTLTVSFGKENEAFEYRVYTSEGTVIKIKYIEMRKVSD